MKGSEKMRINGANISLGENKSLYEFLYASNYDITKIAVECNGEIVPRKAYKDFLLHDEDALEVVRFVGGG